jgi:hypothetical protein
MEATNAWNAQREGNRADYSTFNDNMYNLLGLDLTKINRGFDNKETALNNQTDRLVSQAGVTGQPPLEWSDKNNPYLNPDGTVKAQYLTEEFDNTGGFAALYNNPNLSEQDKYYISRARGLKTDLPQYRQYAGEIPVAGTQQTAAVQSDNAVRANERYGFDSQERIADKALASTKDTNAAGITTQRGVDQTNVTIAQIEANLQRELAQMESPAQQIQAIYNSPLPQEHKDALIASIFGGSNNGSYKPKLTAALAKDAYDTGPRTESVINDYNYWFGGGNAYTPEEYPTDPAAIARLEGNNLISLVADYKQLYNSLTVAEKSVIENNLRQTAERYLKNDGKKYGSWEVHSLLKGYGIPDADAKRISGQ